MSYEPTVWKDGDLVTSAKLNKLEQGVANGGGVLVVHADENGRLDKTWQEIYDADLAVLLIMEDSSKGVFPINEIYIENDTYCVEVSISMHTTYLFSTSAPDDYPSYDASQQQSDSSDMVLDPDSIVDHSLDGEAIEGGGSR